MKKKILKNLTSFFLLFFFIFIFFSSFLQIKISYSHPLLKEAVIEFLTENPNLTEKEIEEFFLEISSEDGAEKVIEEIKKSELFLSLKKEREKPFWQNSWDFLLLGIKHILIGLDHILFILALFLILIPIKKILTIVTTFTLAHSITLIFAGSGILTLSGKIVEPIIALSIAYVAITNVFFQEKKIFKEFHNKVGVVFLFGLFHGLGFAGVFSQLKIPTENFISSLLFFNIGVEFGQILILVLALPILFFLKKKQEKIYFITIKILAVFISILAFFWAIERIFF